MIISPSEMDKIVHDQLGPEFSVAKLGGYFLITNRVTKAQVQRRRLDLAIADMRATLAS